jgi:hypothetical protein
MIFFWFPETKGKSLEEIDFYFASKYNGGQELRDVEMEIGRARESMDCKPGVAIVEDATGAGEHEGN